MTCSFAFAENSGSIQSTDVSSNSSSILINNSNNSAVNNSNVPSSSTSSTSSSGVSSTSSSKVSSVSSSSSKIKAAGEPTKLSQAAIFKASKNVKNYVLKNNVLPNYVTISGYKFSIPEYMYLVSKAITLKNKKSKSLVTIKWNIKHPVKPSGSSIKKTIPKATYLSWSKKTSDYISKYKKAPTSISSKYGKVQFQTAVYGFARVGEYIYTNKKVPKTLSLNIPKTHKLNKVAPFYDRSSNSSKSSSLVSNSKYKISADKNAIWLKGWDASKINSAEMDKLIGYGIKNIFIEEFIFTAQGESFALSWIKNASKKGIKIHIWLPVFYNSTSKTWVNPIQNKTLNQAFFNTIINKAKKYIAIDGVSGIHLDYLRYPGTAYKYNYTGGTGADAVTEFTRQLSVAVKKIKPNAVVSAAVMPETNVNAYYYGQDIPKLGKHLDVIVPMVYKGNYNAKTTWIQSTTAWFVKNSGGAEIWSGLQSYVSDSNIKALSVTALTTDVTSVFAGGAAGVAFFRWGLTSFFNLLGI